MDTIDSAPLLDIDGPRATLRLNRPSQHNRIDPDDVPVMQGYLDQILARPEIRVLVIASNGSKSFSSGYTLQAILERLQERGFEAVRDRLETLPLPPLAAIHGGVYGGATDLALCCDLRIGVSSSRMFMPAAKFGLHYYPGGMRRYVERLGLTASTRLFLTAAIDRTVADLVATEPLALAAMKRSLAELGATRAAVAPIESRYLDSLASPALHQRLKQRLG